MNTSLSYETTTVYWQYKNIQAQILYSVCVASMYQIKVLDGRTCGLKPIKEKQTSFIGKHLCSSLKSIGRFTLGKVPVWLLQNSLINNKKHTRLKNCRNTQKSISKSSIGICLFIIIEVVSRLIHKKTMEELWVMYETSQKSVQWEN